MDTVVLTCFAEGGPGNTIQWSFNGNTLENETLQSLQLVNVTAMSNGGTYTCVVSNSAGNGSFSTNLYIRPIITLNPTNQIASINTEEVSFSCAATAFPPPLFQWMKEDGFLPNTAVGINSTTLTISPIEFGYEGIYYCIATSNNITIESNRATLSSTFLC